MRVLMMNKLIIVFISAVSLVGCEAESKIESKSEFVMEENGCKVYRFRDYFGERYKYYFNCSCGTGEEVE